jgi:hypothetical protein
MEYKYRLTARPVVPSMLPPGGLIRADLCFDKPCPDSGWGVTIYDRPLTEEEAKEYHLDIISGPQPKPKHPMGVIIRNRARCLACGDILESTSVHDFVTCSCGNVSVDGGHDYLKRSVKDWSKYQDLSVTIFPQLSESED